MSANVNFHQFLVNNPLHKIIEMDTEICRTCLEIVLPDSCKSLYSPADEELQLLSLNTVGDALKNLISETNLDITESPSICTTCYEELLIGIKFKYKCIESEELIKSCIDSTSSQCVPSDVSVSENTNERQQEVIVIEVEKNANNQENLGGAPVSAGAQEIVAEKGNTLPEQSKKEELPSDKTKKPFECTACSITFPNYESLESHAVSDHDVEQFYSCKVCQNIFSNAQRAQEHALQHIGSGKYSCEDMTRILPHYINGTPKMCKKCQNGSFWCCQFKAEPSELCCKCLAHKGTFSVLFEKIVTRKSGGPCQEVEINKLQCSYCPKSFLFEDDMKKHLQSHQARRYSCGECGQEFSRKSFVGDHIELVHKGIGAFECNKCGRRYTKRESFNRHMRLHAGEIISICEICGKDFMTRGDLAKHVRRHLGDKRHQCPICGKLFVIRYSMLEHERTHDKNHTTNNKYVCEVCGKVLASTGSLSLHKARYCSVGRYKCELCDKTFRYKRHQKSHMQDHVEHPSHKCHICDLNYPSWLALRKHQRAQHRLSDRTTELQPTQPTGSSRRKR